MSYRYETHCHTALSSGCGRFESKQIIDFYRERGYAGIFVTDHFFNGYSVANFKGDISWREKVDILVSGYEGALEAAKGLDFDVFLGWEYTSEAADFLTYGLDKQWLYDHPDVMSLTAPQYFDLVHECGGYIVHAHPFRQADYIRKNVLYPNHIDAVEIINASHKQGTYFNDLAKCYCECLQLTKSAGSDAHGPMAHLAGLEFDHRLTSVRDYIDSMRDGKGRVFEIFE